MACVLFVALLALAVFTTTVLADTKEEITADNSEVDHNVLKLNHDGENKKYERVGRSDNNQDVYNIVHTGNDQRFGGRRRFEGGRRFGGGIRFGGGGTFGGGPGRIFGGGRFGGGRRYHGADYGGRGGYGGHGSARYDGDHGSARYGGHGQFPYARGHGKYPRQGKVPYDRNQYDNNNGWRNQ